MGRPVRTPVLVSAMVVVASLLALNGSLVIAHSPVDGDAAWAQYASSTYRWDGTVPAWLKTPMTTALETDWPSADFNNARRVLFSFLANGNEGLVLYRATTGIPECDRGDWRGCAQLDADGGTAGFQWRLWMRKPAAQSAWAWCDVDSTKQCWDSRRVAIHEIAHIGGALYHDLQTEANTVMGTTAPWCDANEWPDPDKCNPGATTNHLQRCDEARMQLLYDVGTSAGPYADCFDHITGAGNSGLISVTTVAATSYAACIGEPVVQYGRLAIKTTADYGPLTNNPLTGRRLYFDRRPPGGAWTHEVTYTTNVSSVAGNNWSKSFVSNQAITYEWRGHYLGEAGVDPGYSPVFTITWSNPC